MPSEQHGVKKGQEVGRAVTLLELLLLILLLANIK